MTFAIAHLPAAHLRRLVDLVGDTVDDIHPEEREALHVAEVAVAVAEGGMRTYSEQEVAAS